MTNCGRRLQIVDSKDFSNDRPSGLDLSVGPGASTLSTGERQRLAIARMLLHRPRILILDETTSSLDPAFEEAVLRTIDQRMPNSTLIVVSHRMHSLSWVGRILVLQDGELVGDGAHSFLTTTNQFYASLLASAL